MEFRNLTPFSVMEYAMDDKHNERHRVVVMKTGFRLVQDAEGQWQTQLMENPALPLCMEDQFTGELNISPVIQESDLAPLKPACDLIINGTAHTPGGVAVPEMFACVKLSVSSGGVLVDKTLRITGQRFYQRLSLTDQWVETEPEPFTSLPLDYRYAFGGECRVEAGSEFAAQIPDSARLTEAQRRDHPNAPSAPLAHSVCPVNPLGRGYMQPWYLRACKLSQVEAPRILAVDSPFTLNEFTACLAGEADWFAPAFQPAGFGAIARTWLPRLPLAGTYDQHWLDTQHPDLPDDFDFGYWNCAPDNQQFPYPEPGLECVLSGFSPDGDIRFALPAHEGRILLRMNNGGLVPQKMHLDTLIIDTNTLTVAMTWRYLMPFDIDARVIEARYNTGM